MENEQSFFQDFESFPRTMRVEEDVIDFFLQKQNSNFETYEIPPMIYEVIDIFNTLGNLVRTKVFTDFITIKSKSEMINVLGFHSNSRFNTELDSGKPRITNLTITL